MKVILLMIIMVAIPMLGDSQGKIISKTDTSMHFIYENKMSSGSMITRAYDVNSIYHNNEYTYVNECFLTSGLTTLKVQTVTIIRRDFTSIIKKLHKKNTYIIIHFFPKYDGTIADVWFVWRGSDRLLTEEEMGGLATELKKLKVSFDGRGVYDTPYCQTLSFGVLPKDLE